MCIHLARTYVVDRPDPLSEVLLSLHLLQRRDGVGVFARWRRRMLSRLDEPAHAQLTRAPPHGYSPDLLTPAASALGLEQGLQRLAATLLVNNKLSCTGTGAENHDRHARIRWG
ncbi:hypothetical protein ACFW1M_35980 [Streptomyces inhibens]|uniref:hypothetical protein n=1 Tax=Streptomyces inhibens TaxID=2293571 RepID=UPI0036AA4209